jgi:hypothetical protein
MRTRIAQSTIADPTVATDADVGRKKVELGAFASVTSNLIFAAWDGGAHEQHGKAGDTVETRS